MRSIVLVLTLAATLAACHTAYIGNEESPFYTVPVGSRVVLNRALTIPPERVGAILQYGGVVQDGKAYTYDPHCKFEVRQPMSAAQTVTPDEFVVTRASQELTHGVDAGGLLYADASKVSGFTFSALLDDDGPSIRAFVQYLYLESDRQPDVFRLSCGKWGYPREHEHVSISDIRRTVGDVITLRLADVAAR